MPGGRKEGDKQKFQKNSAFTSFSILGTFFSSIETGNNLLRSVEVTFYHVSFPFKNTVYYGPPPPCPLSLEKNLLPLFFLLLLYRVREIEN